MDAHESLLARRSRRAHDPARVVDYAALAKIVDAGRYAPSGMGRRPVRFVVVWDRAVRDQLSRMKAEIMGATGGPFYGAPVVVVVLVDTSAPTSQDDGALVMGNLHSFAV